jgi:hypothetical protein
VNAVSQGPLFTLSTNSDVPVGVVMSGITQIIGGILPRVMRCWKRTADWVRF